MSKHKLRAEEKKNKVFLFLQAVRDIRNINTDHHTYTDHLNIKTHAAVVSCSSCEKVLLLKLE